MKLWALWAALGATACAALAVAAWQVWDFFACSDDFVMLGEERERLVLSSELVTAVEVPAPNPGEEESEKRRLLVTVTLSVAGQARLSDFLAPRIGQAVPLHFAGRLVSKPVTKQAFESDSLGFWGLYREEAEAFAAAVQSQRPPCQL